MLFLGLNIVEVVDLFEGEADLEGVEALHTVFRSPGVEYVVDIPELVVAGNHHCVASALILGIGDCSLLRGLDQVLSHNFIVLHVVADLVKFAICRQNCCNQRTA